MTRLAFRAALLAVFLIPQTLASAADDATEQGCVVENARFVCADGSADRATVFAAMASTKTASAVNALRYRVDLFSSSAEHEAYRRSLERNWRRTNSYLRRRLQDLRRRRISANDFEELMVSYRQARENYEAAINLYREDLWFGRRG